MIKWALLFKDSIPTFEITVTYFVKLLEPATA